MIVSYSILISANGLSVVTDRLESGIKISCFMVSFLISFPPIIVEYTKVSTSKWHHFFNIIEIISFYVYFACMFGSADDSKTQIAAHLYIIGKQGIHPITTPIYRKYLLFKDIYNCISLIFFMTAIAATIFYIFDCIFIYYV